MAERCSFCGEEHPLGPVGQPGSWLEGIEIKTCPSIPEGHVFEDREYERGPGGALHRLAAASGEKRRENQP